MNKYLIPCQYCDNVEERDQFRKKITCYRCKRQQNALYYEKYKERARNRNIEALRGMAVAKTGPDLKQVAKEQALIMRRPGIVGKISKYLYFDEGYLRITDHGMKLLRREVGN